MSIAKKRSEQHLIDAEGERLLRSLLPRHWVLREYRPDYGLDFSLETFKSAETSDGFSTYETLGEHIFIQLKSVASAKSFPLQLYGRGNVEKQAECLNKKDPIALLNTIRFSLDTAELATVERMGVGVPVLLIIADIATSQCYFVCLNDYIDKILIPKHGDYTSKASRTIHVPTLNQVGNSIIGQTALSWYAKRPKLYAAFQRFIFQETELRYAWGRSDALPMARYFASRLASYDFWDDTETWGLLSHYGNALHRFITDGYPGLMKYNDQIFLDMANGDSGEALHIKEQFRLQEVLELWRCLSVLPRNYEEVCREWFLPTGLSYLTSYYISEQ